MKILDNEMLKQVIEDLSSSAYFYQKEKSKARDNEKDLYEQDGSIILTFTSGIVQVEPGEEDILGKIWNPPIKDKDGNPEFDKSGKPKKAWDKFEAKTLIKGKEFVYGLGSNFGAQLKGVYNEMVNNNIINTDLAGTQWKFKALGNYKWDVSYIGKVELPKKANGKKPDDDQLKEKVLQAIGKVINNTPLPKALAGIDKKEFIDAVLFFAEEADEKKINSMWKGILESGIIKEDKGKVFFK